MREKTSFEGAEQLARREIDNSIHTRSQTRTQPLLVRLQSHACTGLLGPYFDRSFHPFSGRTVDNLS